MKITVYSLTIDHHSGGNETRVYGTAEDRLRDIRRIIEEGIDQPWSTGWDPQEEKTIHYLKESFEIPDVMYAWSLFYDGHPLWGGQIRHPDDYYWLETHEVDVPWSAISA